MTIGEIWNGGGLDSGVSTFFLLFRPVENWMVYWIGPLMRGWSIEIESVVGPEVGEGCKFQNYETKKLQSFLVLLYTNVTSALSPSFTPSPSPSNPTPRSQNEPPQNATRHPLPTPTPGSRTTAQAALPPLSFS